MNILHQNYYNNIIINTFNMYIPNTFQIYVYI